MSDAQGPPKPPGPKPPEVRADKPAASRPAGVGLPGAGARVGAPTPRPVGAMPARPGAPRPVPSQPPAVSRPVGVPPRAAAPSSGAPQRAPAPGSGAPRAALGSAAASTSAASSATQARPVLRAAPARPAAPPQPAALDPQTIYWVRSNLDPTALVARRAGIDEGWLHWDDTNRDRQRRVEDVQARDGDALWVLTEGAVEYTFTPITLQIYEEHIRTFVELSPEFETTDELVHFYRTASFG